MNRADLKALHERATPGRWEVVEGHGGPFDLELLRAAAGPPIARSGRLLATGQLNPKAGKTDLDKRTLLPTQLLSLPDLWVVAALRNHAPAFLALWEAAEMDVEQSRCMHPPDDWGDCGICRIRAALAALEAVE